MPTCSCYCCSVCTSCRHGSPLTLCVRYMCAELKVRGVQEIVKGQELPSNCDIDNRRLLFLFYALHESSNNHLTAAVAEQLHSELTFRLLLSPYDFYVMQYCLSKTTHLRRMKLNSQFSNIYQLSEFAVPCISSVASTNALTTLALSLSSFTLSGECSVYPVYCPTLCIEGPITAGLVGAVCGACLAMLHMHCSTCG